MLWPPDPEVVLLKRPADAFGPASSVPVLLVKDVTGRWRGAFKLDGEVGSHPGWEGWRCRGYSEAAVKYVCRPGWASRAGALRALKARL